MNKLFIFLGLLLITNLASGQKDFQEDLKQFEFIETYSDPIQQFYDNCTEVKEYKQKRENWGYNKFKQVNDYYGTNQTELMKVRPFSVLFSEGLNEPVYLTGNGKVRGLSLSFFIRYKGFYNAIYVTEDKPSMLQVDATEDVLKIKHYRNCPVNPTKFGSMAMVQKGFVLND